MIRTQKKTPEWVYEFAAKVKPTQPVLECLVLEEPKQVVLNDVVSYQDVYSDWYYDYKPVAVVPYKNERSVKIYYREWEEEFDKLVGIKPWHEHRLEERERAARMYDFGKLDPRHHSFDYVGEYEVYLFDVSESVKETFLIFQDVYEANWYITRSLHFGVNTT